MNLRGGIRLRLDHAVRIVLGDLDDLPAEAQAGRDIDADRWEQLGVDLAICTDWLSQVSRRSRSDDRTRVIAKTTDKQYSVTV